MKDVLKKLSISILLCSIVQVFLKSIDQLNHISFIFGVLTLAIYQVIYQRLEDQK